MITRKTRINNLNGKPSLILWGRVRFKSYVFVLKFTSLSYFFMSRGCSRNLSPSRLPVSPMYNFFAKGASYIVNDIGRFAREVISNLNESPRSSPLRYE